MHMSLFIAYKGFGGNVIEAGTVIVIYVHAPIQTRTVNRKQGWLLSGSGWLREPGATSKAWLRARALGNS